MNTPFPEYIYIYEPIVSPVSHATLISILLDPYIPVYLEGTIAQGIPRIVYVTVDIVPAPRIYYTIPGREQGL